jgi:hypothetical protein
LQTWFGRGFCKWEEQCKYSHDNESLAESAIDCEEEEDVPEEQVEQTKQSFPDSPWRKRTAYPDAPWRATKKPRPDVEDIGSLGSVIKMTAGKDWKRDSSDLKARVANPSGKAPNDSFGATQRRTLAPLAEDQPTSSFPRQPKKA